MVLKMVLKSFGADVIGIRPTGAVASWRAEAKTTVFF